MSKLVIRLVINAAALWAAAYFVDSVRLTENIGQLLLVALVFGLVNALIKPVVKFFAFPLTLITLGLFTLVINALMLMLTAAVIGGLQVDGFGGALLGGIVISIVSTLLSMFLSDDS